MDFGNSSSRFPLENHQYGFQTNNDSRSDLEQHPQQVQEMDSSSLFIEKEHMFDKVVTPSDVGKLNRLVIPKQHAEKYFPLDSSSNEKGLLLNFEDRTGKSWRFRYSYWTSSQSYVMTKGWSRFVKEKRLDAGDIVSFHRGLGDVGKDRFFIDWRRRPPHAVVDTAVNFHHGGAAGGLIPHHFQLHQWSPVATPLSLHRDHFNNVGLIHNHNPYYNNCLRYHPSIHDSSVYYHLRSAPPPVAVPVVAGGSGGIGKGGGAAKTLRLFGVDVECGVSEVRSDDECDITNSTTTMSPPFHVYNGMPMSMPMSMSSRDDIPTMDFFDKGKSSMSSLDFGHFWIRPQQQESKESMCCKRECGGFCCLYLLGEMAKSMQVLAEKSCKEIALKSFGYIGSGREKCCFFW